MINSSLPGILEGGPKNKKKTSINISEPFGLRDPKKTNAVIREKSSRPPSRRLCPVNCPTDGAAGSGRRIDPAIVLRAERAGRTSSRRKLVPGRRNEVQVPKVLRTQRKKQEPTCTFSDREVCIGTCAQKSHTRSANLKPTLCKKSASGCTNRRKPRIEMHLITHSRSLDQATE